MNKKIFTLLAGAFLMLFAVFSVKAQGPMWSKSRLNLGDSVPKLAVGYNPGYYHLRVDSIIRVGASAAISFKDSSKVLYMGKPNTANGTLQLFVDSINSIIANNPNQFSAGASTSKAEASAASLWCVSIDKYIQGKNPIFDFINKQQDEMLQVDVYNYENWPNYAYGTARVAGEKTEHAATNLVPGGVSGWEFSGTYATMLESRPLISYITPDTVAVLCMNSNRPGSGTDSVYVKIASATDVQNRLVDGVIYFRLMQAAPFIVNAVDYNSMFGSKPASSGRLTFSPDVNDNGNPFSQKDLTAHYFTAAPNTGMRIITKGPWDPYNNAQTPLPFPADNYDTVRYTNNMLDSLGYMYYTNGTQQLQVKREYFTGNMGGNQFLKIELGPTYNSTTTDSLFYGQYAFRMVYYPSGDSIYINPYQATYLPLKGSDAQIKYLPTYNANVFTDSVTLSVFTYYADTAALQHPTSITNPYWSAMPGTATATPAEDSIAITARLKYGDRTSTFYEPYLPWQRLYVSLQDLNGARRLTLNSTAVKNNGKINTQINFNLYNPCGGGVNPDRVTVAPDVYLIRNTAGQYLQVPLYSATDSALWVTLEANVDPRYVPSFHWVVEQRYPGYSSSTVKITNREFDWLKFDNVQLYTDIRPLRLRSVQYDWSMDPYKVNAKTTDWAHKDANNYAFIKVDKQFKNDPLLGYTWINPDSSVVSGYAFRHMSGISNQFLSWGGTFKDYPNTDTLVYVKTESETYDKMYFTVDTIHEDGYGNLATYGFQANTTTQIADLVTLKRQQYRLTYTNPFRYYCVNDFCLTPDENKNYSITKKGYYKEFLGKPVFYLRHVYKVDGKDPYFALVQTIDSTTTSPSYAQDTAALRAYLATNFGAQYAAIVMSQLTTDKFNPGVFVAKLDPATAKLRMTSRPENQLAVTTFSMERGNDPLYRRFNTEKEGENNDKPDYVHFFSTEHPEKLLFENRGMIQPQYWTNYGPPLTVGKKNYLGIVDSTQYKNLESHSSTTIFVDTAYVNRGTGYIKPQYMLAVRPQIIEDGMGCDQYGEPKIPLAGYIDAYYLINAHDSAYTSAGTNRDYLWPTAWTRLVFTRAIHAEDYLYIVGNADLAKADIYGKLKNGTQMFDLTKLKAYAMNPANGMHAIYLGNNLHKDCVFSFRYAERNAEDFFIESETTARDWKNGPMIAPCEGGWLREQNEVMIVTPSDEVDGMNQALLMNVRKAGPNEKPTDNGEVKTSNVTVVGNAGAVTIRNAAGKSVVISNILGQTVAKTVLTSDDQTIPATKGVVIVSIDGEETVKTLVK